MGFYEARQSIEFTTNDFAEIKPLAAKLDKATNAISAFLKPQLSENSRQWDAVARTNAVPPQLAESLTADFNRLIHGPLLFNTNAFKDVALSRGATNLLATATSEADHVRLNRVLLDEAYPLEIRKSNHWLLRIPFFHTQLFFGLLSLFIVIRGIDGYLQAYGAPGMIKINTAWFAHRERGRFAGIFGFMINLGRFGIFYFGPALLAGFVFLGMWRIPPLHWRWLFWVPSIICGVVAFGMLLTVESKHRKTPASFVLAAEPAPAPGEVAPSFGQILLRIITPPTIWIVALAYACTGAVRQAVDQWFPRYMQDMFQMDLNSAIIPVAWFSDTFCCFRGFPGFRIYFRHGFQGTSRTGGSRPLFSGDDHNSARSVTISYIKRGHCFSRADFADGELHAFHSWHGGGDGYRRAAQWPGLLRACIDSFQYFGGSLAGIVLGWLLDKSLGQLFLFYGALRIDRWTAYDRHVGQDKSTRSRKRRLDFLEVPDRFAHKRDLKKASVN